MSGSLHLKKWLDEQQTPIHAGYGVLFIDIDGKLKVRNEDGTITQYNVNSVNTQTGDVVITLEDMGGLTAAEIQELVEAYPGINGKSAYEVAVDNGFAGTEAEWLASLQGGGGSGGGLAPTYPPYASGLVLKSTSTDSDPSGCYWDAIDSNSEDEPINSAQAYLQEKKYIKAPNAFFSNESGKYETEELIVANNGSVSFTFGQQLNIEEFDFPDPSNNEIVYAFEFSFIDATGSVLAYKSVFGQVSNSSIQFFLSAGGGEFINTDLVSVTVPEGEYRLKINCRISNTANCYVMNHIYVKTTGVAHSTNLGLYGIFKRAVNYI